jgi:predicted transcriptional regulator
MRIEEIIELLGAKLLIGEESLTDSVDFGYSCDLMSDVLAFVRNNVLLLTGLIHPQVIRTAEMLDIKAILIVRGKAPSEEVLRMAKMSDIAIIATKHSLFTASGILFNAGLKGEEIAHHELTF